MAGYPPYQLVTLVVDGGTPVQLVDQTGAPFATTGTGALVFANGPTLYSPTFTGSLTVEDLIVSGSATISGDLAVVGAITSGLWHGTTIGVAYGGTGLTSYTTGDLIYASGTTTLAKLGIGSEGQVLTVSGGVPVWAADLSGVTSFSAGTTGLTPSTPTTGAVVLGGTLKIANGGTNSTATPTAGAVAYGTGTAYGFTAAGTAGQYLQSAGAGTPTWTSPSASGIGSPGYYASLYDDGADQTAASTTTANIIRIGTTAEASGISVVSNGSYLSRITVANAGTYTFTPSIQFVSTDASIHDVSLWFRKNGTNIADSNNQFSVPNKHGAVNGNLIAIVALTLTLAAGDYIELVWSTTSTNVYIHTYPAGTSPVNPVVPGVIVAATSQPQIGIGYYNLTSTTSTLIGTGSKTFTVNTPSTSSAFTVGTRVRVAYTTTPSNWMEGVVTAYSGTTLTVNVDAVGGSGTYASWTFSVAGVNNSSLVVGTTAITSGTSGYILYNNAGTLGNLSTTGTAGSVVLSASPTFTGNVGIGASGGSNTALTIGQSTTGTVSQYGVLDNQTIGLGTTTQFNTFYSNPATAASAFTLSNLRHFYASQGVIGATSAVTNQFGFVAESTLTGATNNYGFYGAIASGANRYNLYMAGTAPNYLAGTLGVGASPSSLYSIRAGSDLTGGTTAVGVYCTSNFQSDVTGFGISFLSSPRTAAAAFNLSVLRHFSATSTSIGAGSSITSQYGFHADATINGATNNYGFYGGLASQANTYNLYMAGTADNYLGGKLGIGASPSADRIIAVGINPTGATNTYGQVMGGTIQSDVTANHSVYYSGTTTQATAFTLTSIRHFTASPPATFGATSTVTNQYGFIVESTLTGATNNYGFYGNIASGTGRFNLYMGGTAANYLKGALQLDGALTYGGVTLSNSVTGTGSMVLSASPTLTGTLTVGTTPYTATGLSIGVNVGNAAGVRAANFLVTNGINTASSHSLGFYLNYNAGWVYNIGSGTAFGGQFYYDGTTGLLKYQNTAAAGSDGAAATLQTPMTIAAAGGMTLNYALTYGGVTLSNSVTGTGSMVLSASPTLTGTLTAAAAIYSGTITSTVSANPALNIDAAAGAYRYIRWRTSGAARWDMGEDNVAESGANAGSNFYLNRVDDAGTGFNTVLNIRRSDGLITVTPSITMSSALTYGGVTLSNSVTGTGSMVLSASPTLTGTAAAAAINVSGILTADGSIRVRGAGGSWFWIDNPTTTTLRISSGATPGTNPLTFTDAGALTAVNVITNTNASGPALALNTAAGTNRFIRFLTSSSVRWDIGASNAAESGGNSGSDFYLNRFDDSGVYLDTPINVLRSTGVLLVNNGLRYGGVTLSNSVTGTGSMVLNTRPQFAGGIGIGAASATDYLLYAAGAFGTGTATVGMAMVPNIAATTTSSYIGYYSAPVTPATAFTLPSARHFQTNGVTPGSGAVITNQYGFIVESSFTQATNNYGFYGGIASGTGRYNLYMTGTADNYLGGSLGIGTTSLAGITLRTTKNITGATSTYNILAQGAIQSDVTSAYYGFWSQPATQAAAFTLPAMIHYGAYFAAASKGAGSTVTSQYGFYVSAGSFDGATNNYAFYSGVAAAANTYNLYMPGTAANYLGGATTFNAAITYGGVTLSNSVTGTGSMVLSASPTLTGTLSAAAATFSGAVSHGQAIIETYAAPAITAGTLTIDLSTATVFNVTVNANITTFTISNATASKAQSFTLFLTANGTGYTQAWGASVKWPGGAPPTLTTTNTKTDIITFVTNNGGTTWYGFVGGQNF